MLNTILIIALLILLLVGYVPRYGFTRNWGYASRGTLTIVLVVVIVLLLSKRL